MLPLFYLGEYPATDIDYGLYDLSELDNARETLLQILKKVDEGKRARVALDLLRRRITDNYRPRNTEQEEFDKLTSTLRYGYSVNRKIDTKVDLSWVPISVFLGLIEHLSSQPLTALSMSRKASHQAFASLWSRPLNPKLQERYYYYLCKEHSHWAQKFRDEVQKSTLKQIVTTVPVTTSSLVPSSSTQPHTGVANLYRQPSITSTIQLPPMRIDINADSYAASFRTHGKLKRGFDGNSDSLIQHNRTGGTPYNFVTMVTSSSTFSRSASSFAATQASSLCPAGEKFQRVKHDFPFAATLLTISTIWGGKDLPRMMYARATVPRKGWSSQGEVEEVFPEPGMRFGVSETAEAIDYLCSSKLLTLDSNEDGYERLSVDPSLQQYLEQQLQGSDQLRIRALMLMCHLFPGDKEIEPFHHKDLGRLQLQPLQRVVAYIPELLRKESLSTQQQHDVIATLLESSNFPDPSSGSAWQFRAVEIADQMLITTPDESLEICAAIRRKALSRLVLGTIYEEPSSLLKRSATTPRSNFLHWKLRLSRAQDCTHRDDFVGAKNEVSHYTTFNPTKPSTLERRLGKEVRFEYARFVYLAGDFPEAKRLFEQELKALNHGEKLYDSLISYLAGAYCEMGDPAEAVRLIKSALPDSQDIRGHSRLHVSLAEALLHLGMQTCTFDPSPSMDEKARMRFSEAKDICERVLYRYRSNPNFDIVNEVDKVAKVDRINYLRVTTIASRISLLKAVFGGGDFFEALCEWVAVFEAIKKCGWAKVGFMEAIGHHTIGAIEMCRGDSAASERDVKTALSLLNEAGRRHLFVGLGIIWPELMENLRTRNGGRRAQDLNAELSS